MRSFTICISALDVAFAWADVDCSGALSEDACEEDCGCRCSEFEGRLSFICEPDGISCTEGTANECEIYCSCSSTNDPYSVADQENQISAATKTPARALTYLHDVLRYHLSKQVR